MKIVLINKLNLLPLLYESLKLSWFINKQKTVAWLESLWWYWKSWNISTFFFNRQVKYKNSTVRVLYHMDVPRARKGEVRLTEPQLLSLGSTSISDILISNKRFWCVARNFVTTFNGLLEICSPPIFLNTKLQLFTSTQNSSVHSISPDLF